MKALLIYHLDDSPIKCSHCGQGGHNKRTCKVSIDELKPHEVLVIDETVQEEKQSEDNKPSKS